MNMIGPAPLCCYCVHERFQKELMACTAYPDGIPDEIFWSIHDHRKPFKGDHGIQVVPGIPPVPNKAPMPPVKKRPPTNRTRI